MKRLLAFLIIPLLFIFACEDEEDETYFSNGKGMCYQITTSDEDVIDEIKSYGYSKGTCDKSGAIAKCEYSDADADELAYQYTTDEYSIQGFKEICEENDGEYELLISEKEEERVTYYNSSEYYGGCDEYTSSDPSTIEVFNNGGYEKGSCNESIAIGKCVWSSNDDDYDYSAESYLYNNSYYSDSEFQALCENDLDGTYEKLSGKTAEPVTPGTDFDTALLIEIGTPVSSAFTNSFYNHYFKINLESGKTYNFYTTGEVDSVGYLYDNSESLLDDDDDGGVDNNFSLTYSPATSGTYYLLVEDYNTGSYDSYDLIVVEY